MPARQPAADLDAEAVVDAALALLLDEGLDAVSMRRVAARLGVSPIPLYSRVGNKDDLLDAVAERILHDLLPGDLAAAPWPECLAAWARALRERLHAIPDSRIVLRTRRRAYVDASRPLVDALLAAGFEPDEAVRTCRLVMWATTGFVVVETGSLERERPTRAARPRRSAKPGGDPAGVDPAEADALFEQHLRYLVDGLAADRSADRAADRSADRAATATEDRPRRSSARQRSGRASASSR
jgi:TetR/AcrR family transcriptional regulator, tetracycline repressor protein